MGNNKHEHTEIEDEIEDDHYTQDQFAQGVYQNGVFIHEDELEAYWEEEQQERQDFKLHKFKKRLEHTWGPKTIESFLEVLDEARAEDFWVAEKPRVQIKLEQLLGNMDKGDVPHIIDQYLKLEAEEQQYDDQLHSPEAFAENEDLS